MTIRLEMTSSAFAGEGSERNLAECRAKAAEFGFEFGVQVHNTANVAVLERFCGLGVAVSVHAPLVGGHLLNLAAADGGPVEEAFRQHAELFRRTGVDRAVFHGFLMTDRMAPNFGNGRSYDSCMKECFRPELSYDGVHRGNRDFTGLGEYAERRERVRRRLAALRRDYPDIHWYIENDFPSYGAGNMFARDMAMLEHAICLDSGHLWATANTMGRDWRDETAAFMATGRVGMVHLHASIYNAGTPRESFGDGHRPLRTPNRMELPGFVAAGRAAGVGHWVLEVVEGSADDVAAFGEMWRAAS